jgi:hypothetical protein
MRRPPQNEVSPAHHSVMSGLKGWGGDKKARSATLRLGCKPQVTTALLQQQAAVEAFYRCAAGPAWIVAFQPSHPLPVQDRFSVQTCVLKGL